LETGGKIEEGETRGRGDGVMGRKKDREGITILLTP